ncbi:MAG: M24 family metallopeptidase [Halioglobus sp.]
MLPLQLESNFFMRRTSLFLLFIVLATPIHASEYAHILPMRERAQVIDRLLNDKLINTLPVLMRREGIDMWLVISREYNEDPVIETLLPATWMAARRRTILVMYDPGGDAPLQTLAVARYAVGEQFEQAWDKEKQPDQWARLAEIIAERQPRKIGINQSLHWGLADGLVATELQLLKENLPQEYVDKLVSAESLAVAWLETRTAQEMQLYPHLCRVAHELIAQAFSNTVIEAGVTTTDDVAWWLREKVRELKLSVWFHPTVSIQRQDTEAFDQIKAFSQRKSDNVILPGDLLHVDFGITYLRLNTDTQQHAYVLRQNETDAPAYLKHAFTKANRLQDIFTGNFRAGATGNEVLAKSRADAIAESIKPTIYTHPLGYHGHAAGATLGMWDSQDGVPGSGDYPLYENTVFSIELNAASYIQEWSKEIRIMLEEDAFFGEEGVTYIDGRQTELIVIPSQ